MSNCEIRFTVFMNFVLLFGYFNLVFNLFCVNFFMNFVLLFGYFNLSELDLSYKDRNLSELDNQVLSRKYEVRFERELYLHPTLALMLTEY